MDSYPRCETCTYFRPPTPPVLHGDCGFIVDVWCADAPNTPREMLEKYDKALLPDTCGGDTRECNHLMVMPTFGCIYHHPKEN